MSTTTRADTPPPPADAGPATVPVGRFEWERLIRDDITLPARAKAVAFVFATYASKEGDEIHPGNELLARGASVSLATMKRIRDELVARGLLTKTRHGNRHRRHADEWQLSMPDLLAVPTVAAKPIPLAAPDTVIVPQPVGDDDGIITPAERARRKVADSLSEFEPNSLEWEKRRAELAAELLHRVTAAEAREMLGYSEIEYRAAIKRRGRSA